MEAKTLFIVALIVAALGGAALLLASQTHAGDSLTTASAVQPAGEAPQAAAPEAPSGGLALPLVASASGLSSEQTGSSTSSETSSNPERHVVATYFHNTTRCATCRAIEQRARETLEAEFANDLATGRLVWRALNMQKKENEHYAMDYALTSPSLVLALMDGDREVRFSVLQDTWTLIHHRVEFETYIIAETLGFLEEL